MLDSPRLRPLKNLSFHSAAAKRLWITISEEPEDTANTAYIDASKPEQTVDNHVEKPATGLAKLVAGEGWPNVFLPIRIFRRLAGPFLSINKAELTFLSSGTTSGPEGRSRSSFSTDGVSMYRGNSLLAFSNMLKYRSGHMEFGGVSLVPPISEWGDSSLARMIHWLAECWDVSYAHYLNFSGVEEAVKTSSRSGTRPVFMFGTAFHLIDFLDQHPNRICTLPPGSIVIETGGTKGRTRSVTRPELYSLIAKGFGITEDQIVSEYGMCELASQAYDVVPVGESKALNERSFRFPAWAPVRVMRDADQALVEGEGALVIWDQARLDIPAPIQVEDLVKLHADGSFKLLGRIPTAPLKGCSLKVEEVLDKTSVSISASPQTGPAITPIDFDHLPARAELVISWLRTLARDDSFATRLAYEFGSETIAHQAIQDLQKSIPQDAAAMVQAAKDALNGKTTLASSWVLIPPSTHSIAAIQPLALLLTLGRDVQLRLTTLMNQDELGSSLERIYALLKKANLSISSLPATWNIKSPEDVAGSALLVFGDNTTIARISEISGAPVTAFGNAVAATVTYAYELQDDAVVEKLIRDNIALSQRGCMSSRINFVIGTIHPSLAEKLLAKFENALRDKSPPALATYVARSLELVRLKELGASVQRLKMSDGLVCFFENQTPDIQARISKQEMNFIFQCVSEEHVLRHLAQKDIKKIAISDSMYSFRKHSQVLNQYPKEFVSLGLLNASPLNGFHLSLPIFL